MKKLIILVFIPALVFAQSGLNVHFRGDVALASFSVNGNRTTHFTKYPLIQSFSFSFGNSFNDLALDLRLGYVIMSENYEGFELGGFIFYSIPNSNLYFDTGLNYHFNPDELHNSGGTGETISQIALGLGYKLSEKIAVELNDFFPLKQKYGFYDGETYKLLNIIKLGVVVQVF